MLFLKRTLIFFFIAEIQCERDTGPSYREIGLEKGSEPEARCPIVQVFALNWAGLSLGDVATSFNRRNLE